MKKLLIVLASLSSLSSAAIAADLSAPPVYKAPAPAPAYSWTGVYLNVGGGYGVWNSSTQTFTAGGACITCTSQTMGGNGFYGVAGGGFDYQFGLNLGAWNPQIVAGLFGDYNFENFKGTIQAPVGFPGAALASSGSIKETSAWAAGFRAGPLLAPQVLSYFTVGVTGTQFGGTSLTSDVTGAATGVTTGSFSQIGWFTGGGFESSLGFILPPGFFLRTEYRYSYFGTQNVNASLAGGTVGIVGFHSGVQTLSTELVYRFNWH
jgi:outer membrane immunogenic protein